METSDGPVILEARLGMIPYMVVWIMLLYILLALQMNMALVVIKIQANKEQRLLDNHLVKREGSKEYKDDSQLMDIYSFPGYQVEIEVPANQDGSSRPVILDKTLRGEVDPVILGKAGVRFRPRRRSSRRTTGLTWRTWGWRMTPTPRTSAPLR
jgi:hypothetical protein